MYIKPLQYFILICLWYPVLHMPSKEVVTSQIMEKTGNFDSETFDGNKTSLKGIKHLKRDSKVSESPVETKTQCVATKEYISIDVCFIFLYHLTTRKSTECILATTALFFWKVSAFPVNSTSSTDRTGETGMRKSRSVSTNNEFDRGDCDKDWFQFEGKCYRAFEEIMNHKIANAYCLSLESELVNIETMNENVFVRDLANNRGISGYLWTAVEKLCSNCTRTAGGFMNWLPGQPSGVSKCVMMNSLGEWRDLDCGYMFAFVCEKALSKTYTKKQLLIALLIPVFSCLTVAIVFTTALLVSSVRCVNQPFKVASRYQRTKKERKPTTWDMVDMLRRASLSRRGSRFKPQRGSAPSIEITKAKDTTGTIVPNGGDKKTPWYKRGNQSKSLNVPEERRRSSNSSSCGNSSLYELLARLNKMEFEPPDETRLNETDNGVGLTDSGVSESECIQMKQLGEHKNGLKPVLIKDDCGLSGSHKQLVQKRQNIDDSTNGQASFRNMAFRDSVVSVETNGSGIAKVTSVQQVNQRDSVGKMGDIQDITSDTEHHEICSRDSQCVCLRDICSRDHCSRDHCSRDSCPRDTSRDENENEASRNWQTVRADVHNISTNASIPARNGNVEKHTDRKPQPSKGKVIWTYSL